MPSMADLEAAYKRAADDLEAAVAAVEGASEDVDGDGVRALMDAAAECETEVERAKGNLDAFKRLSESRSVAAGDVKVFEVRNTAASQAVSTGSVSVGSEPGVYRPDVPNSFFRDLVQSGKGDREAQERLSRHDAQMRGVTSADPGAAGFIPPIYLAEKWAELKRPPRPFVDALPKYPLPADGMTITIPKVQSGVTVASQNGENTALSETDIDTQSVTTPVRTIGGFNDISVQAVERSYPGMDMVIYDDLRRAYMALTDSQALHGAGTNGTHTGIFSVAGTNAVTYTDASPTGAELLPKVYDAIQRINSNQFSNADVVVMHPRRAAWLASQLSTSFPLFQQGGLYQAAGTQDNGLLTSFAGLRVLIDANIATNLGVGTNEDAIAVVSMADMFWSEGDLRVESFRDVGSANLTVRLRMYAYSAFVANRQPTAISTISGTGLVAPTF